MTLEKTFCPSPWFHMRITNNGGMTYCRWSNKLDTAANIQKQSPIDFFQTGMQQVRTAMLNGDGWSGCGECVQMEQHGKVSGRQRQLLKIGVDQNNFAKSLKSSPWTDTLVQKHCDKLPQDWQIDLGNYCNSGCVFCGPDSSSRLATEQLALGMIQALPPANWTDRDDLLQKFFDTIEASENIKYMHFIGGETLIAPAFAKILQHLIDHGFTQSVTIGFTTNLTVWPQSVIDLICEFDQVNVGLSVEAFAPVNDYVRWPSKLSVVEKIFSQWTQLCHDRNWYVQIRSTPTLLSLPDLLSLYDSAWQQNVAIESCNFLQEPAFLRASVLPSTIKSTLINQFQQWLDQHVDQSHNKVINTRDPNVARQQICQDLQSYIHYLTNEADQSHRAADLAAYLTKIESVRGNCVLDYRPEYEEFLRAAGY